jgi:hypothetical protein
VQLEIKYPKRRVMDPQQSLPNAGRHGGAVGLLRGDTERIRGKEEERNAYTELQDAGRHSGSIGSSRNKAREERREKGDHTGRNDAKWPLKEATSR